MQNMQQHNMQYNMRPSNMRAMGGAVPAVNLTLGVMMARIRKHIVAAAVAFAVVVAAIGVITLLTPAQYEATAQAFATYNDDSSRTDDYSTINSASSYINNQIKSYPALTQTDAVLQPVIDDLGLDTTVDGLAQQLTVTNPTNTAFVNITVTDGDSQVAADIANAVAESLQRVVEQSLYSDNADSPVKLSIVKQAVVPQSAASPNIPLYMALAVALGLVLGVMVALLKDAFVRTVEESRDLIDIVDAPVLGRIPHEDALEKGTPVIISDAAAPVAEEFRRIRTGLSLTAASEGMRGRLVVISSVGPDEGKTTTAVNLAAALAENGSSVLFIDADLRKPSVANRLNLAEAGLANVLSGQIPVKDVIQRYWKPNLHVLPAGPEPPNASALLNCAQMDDLLDSALQRYDYVLIDTSPMAVANDAAVFGAKGSGVVMVARRGATQKRGLRDVAEQLANLDVPVVGFVFNFDRERSEAGKYYRYYHKDGGDAEPDGKKTRGAKRRSGR